jgi:hypothetical protein
MMPKKEDLLKRFDELIESGKALMPMRQSLEYHAKKEKWQTICQALLERTFGKESVFLASFQKILSKSNLEYHITSGLSIMEGAREELDLGKKSSKLDEIKKEITEGKAEAERRATVAETKFWGSVIELIDMQREELKGRSQLNQDMISVHNEIREVKSILTEMKDNLKLISEQESRELRDRIRGELEITLQEVTSDYEKEAFQSRAFFMEGFIALKQDLIRKLDAKTFRAVLDAYIKIEQLRHPAASKEDNRKEYKETIEFIKKTIDLLK